MTVRFWPFLAMGLVLSACVDSGKPSAGLAYVEIAGGGAFSGSTALRIHPDDRLETILAGPFGEGAKRSVKKGRPGVYQQVLQLALAEGPKVQRKLAGREEYCLDYGTDAVWVVPEVGGFKGVSAGCPEAAMLELQSRLRTVISGG